MSILHVMYPYLEKTMQLAQQYEWQEIDHQENICMISFKKQKMRINVYYSTRIVGTYLKHPKHGKTQLFRRHVDLVLLEKIFKNPRIHTKVTDKYRGYRERRFLKGGEKHAQTTRYL